MNIFGKTQIDNSKRYIALAIYKYDLIILRTTRKSTWCSYGLQRWCDDFGYDYGQIDMPYLGVDFLSISEIPDEVANKIDTILEE